MKLAEIPRALTDEERAELMDGEEDPFELADVELPAGRRKDHYFVLREEGRIVAAAGLLTATVTVGGACFPVAGIGGVLVTHARRGQGLFHQVFGPTLRAAERLGPDFALLFCLRKNAPLYAKLGFQTIPDPVTADDTVIPIDTMWRPLTPGARWPAGPVALHGPMF